MVTVREGYALFSGKDDGRERKLMFYPRGARVDWEFLEQFMRAEDFSGEHSGGLGSEYGRDMNGRDRYARSQTSSPNPYASDSSPPPPQPRGYPDHASNRSGYSRNRDPPDTRTSSPGSDSDSNSRFSNSNRKRGRNISPRPHSAPNPLSHARLHHPDPWADPPPRARAAYPRSNHTLHTRPSSSGSYTIPVSPVTDLDLVSTRREAGPSGIEIDPRTNERRQRGAPDMNTPPVYYRKDDVNNPWRGRRDGYF